MSWSPMKSSACSTLHSSLIFLFSVLGPGALLKGWSCQSVDEWQPIRSLTSSADIGMESINPLIRYLELMKNVRGVLPHLSLHVNQPPCVIFKLCSVSEAPPSFTGLDWKIHSAE